MEILKNNRRGTDVLFTVTLQDGGVSMDWSACTILEVFMYSKDQRAYAGRCSYSVDAEDSEKLNVLWPAGKQEYLGVHMIIVRLKFDDRVATYDAPAINQVATVEEIGTAVVEVPEPISISLESVSTTVLQELIDACIAATAATADAILAAEDAASLAATKAGLASEAASLANSKAELADEKAGEAGRAAQAAAQAAEAANQAAATTTQMNAGLIGLKVDDGELILVQNAETGTVVGSSIDDDGMVTVEFEV